MESKRHVSPSSSLSADIFGERRSAPSSASAGTFASIFPPPHTVAGRKQSSELMKQSPGNFSDGMSANVQRGGEPYHLSSSLHYGGREVYSQSPSTQNPGSYPIFKKDGEKDDPNEANPPGASRGNWWQGSLYY